MNNFYERRFKASLAKGICDGTFSASLTLLGVAFATGDHPKQLTLGQYLAAFGIGALASAVGSYYFRYSSYRDLENESESIQKTKKFVPWASMGVAATALTIHFTNSSSTM